MSKQTRQLIVTLAGLVVAVLWAQVVLGDVLVTRSGKRWEGKVTVNGDSYVLERPGGGKLTFPKIMVKEVIKSGQFKARYKKMLKTADLTDNIQVEKLARFAHKGGLVKERRKLLTDIYTPRLAKAKGKLKALRALAKWCRKYSMKDESAACRLRINKLEFPAKLADAGSNLERLEKLARWCMGRNMPEEKERCLAGQYEVRNKRADTPRRMWKLAEWCHKWKMSRRRDEQYLAAIRAAGSRGDLSALTEFLDLLKEGNCSPTVKRACRKAIYDHCFKSAGNDAMALAKLSIWCGEQGFKAEAAASAAAALKISPENNEVRWELGYSKDTVSGGWIRAIWQITDAHTSELAPAGGNRWVMTIMSGGDKAYLYVTVRFKRAISLKNLKRFRIVNSSGKSCGELCGWRNGTKALLIFKGIWSSSSLKGLYLQGLRGRQSLPAVKGDKPRKEKPKPSSSAKPVATRRNSPQPLSKEDSSVLDEAVKRMVRGGPREGTLVKRRFVWNKYVFKTLELGGHDVAALNAGTRIFAKVVYRRGQPKLRSFGMKNLVLVFNNRVTIGKTTFLSGTVLKRGFTVWEKVTKPNAFEKIVADIAKTVRLGKENDRLIAASALGNLGPLAMKYIPVLIKALGDKGWYVAERASQSLKNLTGQDFGRDHQKWKKWWDREKRKGV